MQPSTTASTSTQATCELLTPHPQLLHLWLWCKRCLQPSGWQLLQSYLLKGTGWSESLTNEGRPSCEKRTWQIACTDAGLEAKTLSNENQVPLLG